VKKNPLTSDNADIILRSGVRGKEMDEISYQKFLTTRICDLELDMDESMSPLFRRLKKELREHRILLWPDFYFGNEWGCVNHQRPVLLGHA